MSVNRKLFGDTVTLAVLVIIVLAAWKDELEVQGQSRTETEPSSQFLECRARGHFTACMSRVVPALHSPSVLLWVSWDQTGIHCAAGLAPPPQSSLCPPWISIPGLLKVKEPFLTSKMHQHPP